MLVRLGVARRTIHRIQDYSICFEEVYSSLQTFIATVCYTLQIVESDDPRSRGSLRVSGTLENCFYWQHVSQWVQGKTYHGHVVHAKEMQPDWNDCQVQEGVSVRSWWTKNYQGNPL